MRFAFALVLALVSLNAHAVLTEKQINSKIEKCMKDNESNLGMKQCVADGLARAEALLAQTYKTQDQRVKGTDEDALEMQARLKKSKEAWAQYRDAQCDYEATEMLGGSGESLVRLGCELTKTLQRVKELSTINQAI